MKSMIGPYLAFRVWCLRLDSRGLDDGSLFHFLLFASPYSSSPLVLPVGRGRGRRFVEGSPKAENSRVFRLPCQAVVVV